VSSLKPRGIVSASISVTQPYLYSRFASISAVLIIPLYLPSTFDRIYMIHMMKTNCFVVPPMNHVNPANPVHASACGAHWPEMALPFHDLMQASINFFFASHQLSQSDLRQSGLHYFMKSDDYRPNAAVAGMNTNIQNARVRLAKMGHGIFIKDANHFTQADLRRRAGERITTFGPALGTNQAGLAQNPHQLAGVRDRQTLSLGDLRQSQRAPVALRARQLHQAPQPVLFLS
jgi:hypothetical protein